MLSEDLEGCLNLAVSEAARRGHEYVTVEHVLYALLSSPSIGEALSSCGGSVRKTREELDSFFESTYKDSQLAPGQLPQPTLGFQRIIQAAVQQVHASGKNEVVPLHVLVAILGEKRSHAAYFLRKQSIEKYDLLKFVSHGIKKVVSTGGRIGSGDKPSDPSKVEGETGQERSSHQTSLEAYCVDLNSKAKKGLIDPLVGREKELERAVHVLCRRRKNNPLFVGEAGVGKTAIAEGVALKIVEGLVPEILKDAEIYSLDLGSLLAGAKFRGDFEQRLKSVIADLAARKKAILFIDEIHTIVGAGAVSGGSLDASNLLKPALASGGLRCIGATTLKEFRQNFEKDHALARRFQKIDVSEPGRDDAVAILQGLKKRYEEFHHVKYSPQVLASAVDLSMRFLPEKRLPDKALDIIDEVGVLVSLRRKGPKGKASLVKLSDVESVVSSMARIPEQRLSAADSTKIRELSSKLKETIYGQDEAIEAVTDIVTMAKAGLRDETRPMASFLFAGPTGVGKTELSRQLALFLGVDLIRFDMSEYMEKHAVSRLIGAPPGYVGYEEGGLLVEAVYKSPHSVILLDEIEKAHPDLLNVLLQVMDHGRLTDGNGREADFRHAIIVMTTNSGAKEIAGGTIGFDKSPLNMTSLSSDLKDLLSPEFRGRLDQIINFKPLSSDLMLKVIKKALSTVVKKLTEKGIDLSVSDEACLWMAKKGFTPSSGARLLARTIERELSVPLAQQLISGRLKKGSSVVVDLDQEKKKLEFKTL